MKTLKEFKKEIRLLGYSVKTHLNMSYATNNSYRHLEVLKDGSYVCGSGGNVFTSEHIKLHEKVFDLLNSNRGLVFDTDYEPPLKVLF